MGLAPRMAVLAIAATLAGCGGGFGFGPFGGARDAAPVVPEEVRPPLVDQIVSMDVAPVPGGVILSAVGLPPTQGFWDAELVRVPSADPSVLALEFRLLPPPNAEPIGTQPSREVLAGRRLSDRALEGVRTIAVLGARNRATSRR